MLMQRIGHTTRKTHKLRDKVTMPGGVVARYRAGSRLDPPPARLTTPSRGSDEHFAVSCDLLIRKEKTAGLLPEPCRHRPGHPSAKRRWGKEEPLAFAGSCSYNKRINVDPENQVAAAHFTIV